MNEETKIPPQELPKLEPLETSGKEPISSDSNVNPLNANSGIRQHFNGLDKDGRPIIGTSGVKDSIWPAKTEKTGGRLPGSLNKSTLVKKEMELAYKNRILQNLADLLNSQMLIAKGASYLYRIDIEDKRKVHILVTDPMEIKRVLDELQDETSGNWKEHYYYITTERPDNRALDSLTDRVFGKSRQNIGLDGGDKDKPIPLLHVMRTKNE